MTAEGASHRRFAFALAGFVLAVVGMAIGGLGLRLAALFVLAVDFGLTPIEAAALPICVVAAAFCLMGPSRGVAAAFKWIGLAIAIFGATIAGALTAAILTFDGGSV